MNCVGVHEHRCLFVILGCPSCLSSSSLECHATEFVGGDLVPVVKKLSASPEGPELYLLPEKVGKTIVGSLMAPVTPGVAGALSALVLPVPPSALVGAFSRLF